jgi:hypothetical protein
MEIAFRELYKNLVKVDDYFLVPKPTYLELRNVFEQIQNTTETCRIYFDFDLEKSNWYLAFFYILYGYYVKCFSVDFDFNQKLIYFYEKLTEHVICKLPTKNISFLEYFNINLTNKKGYHLRVQIEFLKKRNE